MSIIDPMERKTRRSRRSFTQEFKADIVERCRAGDRSISQVARDFELTETAVRAWVKQAEVDAGERDGLVTEERQEYTHSGVAVSRLGRLPRGGWPPAPHSRSCPPSNAAPESHWAKIWRDK